MGDDTVTVSGKMAQFMENTVIGFVMICDEEDLSEQEREEIAETLGEELMMNTSRNDL